MVLGTLAGGDITLPTRTKTFPSGPPPLIHSQAFRDRVQAMGIKQVVTAPRSPWQNPYVDRLIGSIRRECLDHACRSQPRPRISAATAGGSGN